MTLQFEYSDLLEPDQARQFGLILDRCFGSPSGKGVEYIDRVGYENFRVIEQAGQVAGGLAVLKMAQWFGGHCVPMAGIAGVGIAPEYRGSGAAIELLQATLQELYDRGIPISMLYPATQYLYRKVGYEQAGVFCKWEIQTSSIQIKERNLPIQPISLPSCDQGDQGFGEFDRIYRQQAKITNGHLDRHPSIWREAIEPSSKDSINYAYLFGDRSNPSGYLIFSQPRSGNSYNIQIRDLVLLNAESIKRFWSLMADHRSQASKVQWRHSIVDLLTLTLAEQPAIITESIRWMLRIVDVVKALELRGYPQGLETELHFEIADDLLPPNHGKFVLNVANGKGEIIKGGKGELKLHVRGLSPLYTGLFTPQQLQLTNHLEATENALLTATKLFAGATPWTQDFF